MSHPNIEIDSGAELMVRIETKGNQSLADDEVHVWRIDVGPSGPDVAAFEQILVAQELERANRFHLEGDRRRSVIGRGCLRVLLGKFLQVPADSLL